MLKNWTFKNLRISQRWFLSFPFWLYSPIQALAASMKLSVSLQLLNLGQSVGLPGRVISSSQGLYLYTNTENRADKHKTSMPWLSFEPTAPASARAKIVHALNRSATVTGHNGDYKLLFATLDWNFVFYYGQIRRTTRVHSGDRPNTVGGLAK
jgi:hypothetical protein